MSSVPAHPNFWTGYYALWILMFLIPELYWIYVNPANTLSEQFWSIEGLNINQPFDFAMWTSVHWTCAVVVWILWGWLSVHLPFGLLR